MKRQKQKNVFIFTMFCSRRNTKNGSQRNKMSKFSKKIKDFLWQMFFFFRFL